MNKRFLLLIVFIIPIIASAQVPATWVNTGIGGGEAFFSPSINPADSAEYYVSCEGSELFHTTSFGASYTASDFRQFGSGISTVVRFTSDPNTRYSIEYVNNLVLPSKTVDGGVTWNAFIISSSGQPDSSSIFSIWADFNNPNRVIVSTQTVVYFSTDGGVSFNLIHFNANPNIGVFVSGAFFDGNNIYVGTNDGVLESTDGGSFFSILPTTGIGQGEGISSFAAAKQGNALRFFCLTGDSTSIFPGLLGSDYNGFMKGIYKMDNNSGTWVSTMNGVDPLSDFMMFVAMAENDTSTAYLGGSSVMSEPNIMKTSNGGLSWNYVFNSTDNENIFTGWCGDSGDYNWNWPQCVLGFAVAAQNKNVVLFTDFSEVMKTNNGGAAWNQAYVNSADQNDSGFATPTRRYYHSVGLENTSCWYLNWSNANNMYVGCSDVFAFRSKDGGNGWSYDYTVPSSTNTTVYCIRKNISNATMYAATSSVHDLYKIYELQDANINGQKGEIIFSTDSGTTWNTLVNFNHPVYWIATDPNNSNRMYASVVNYGPGGGIWVTNDLNDGASSVWSTLPASPRAQGHPACLTVLNNGKLLCTNSGRASSSTGLLTANSGVFLYDPSVGTWTDESAYGELFWSQDIIADANDTSQNTWYCGVYNGFGGVGQYINGLYKTTNGGNKWTRVFSGGDVSSCTINPRNGNEMFVTTNGNGLWFSSNINAATPMFSQVASYSYSSPERVFFNPFDQSKLWITSFGNGLQWADEPTGVVELNNNMNPLLLYPNPSNGNVSINVGEKTLRGKVLSTNLKVFDITGRETRVSVQADGSNILLDVSNLPSGVYFVQLKLDDQLLTTRLVKQ